ncbi:hypothetical protein KR054_012282 [Drosophila jambulina]|nr:hypothetical protein KR054_012282 [Drosophila jambulina]
MSEFENLAGSDKELQEFLMIEKQKAQVNAQVSSTFPGIRHPRNNNNLFPYAQIHEFNEICWEKCIGKPSNKLDSATETCLSNCVDRFIDTSLLITQRFAQMLQKHGGE